jgi:phosphoglycolate phosphatase-like HAD superfamily hydrolase
LQNFYQRFHEEVAKQLNNDAELLPGVESLLQRLSLEENVFLGLVTGNTTKGSEIKLARFDLNRFFPIGAFGDELRERGKLVTLAVEKAKEYFQAEFDLNKVFVVGDTPQDISAAIYSNTRGIGVCTGHFDEKSLTECGAELVLPDLGFQNEFMEFVLEN